MKKKINSQKSIEVITNALQNIENHIPNEMRKTYSFKGRKSPEIISKILEALTKTNDIIFDPFIGSGTSIIGSHLAKRHLIGTELDPFTFAIDKVLFEKINKVELKYIKKVLFDPQNGKDGYLYPVENREIKNGKNVKLLDKCSICGASDKHFTEEDWLNIQEQMKMSTDGFPTDRLIENSRINITRSTGADRYDIFFSHRNKLALLALQESISKLKPSKSKDFLQYCLVSSLSLAKIAMYGSSTDILYHVVLEKAQDMNVWYLFEQKIKSFKNFQKKFENVLVENFSSSEEYAVFNMDYSSYLKANPNLKVDAIFTDFPYTDQVPYLERNQLFRIWLEHFADNRNSFLLSQKMLDDEIVVTNAPSRRYKNLDNYIIDLDMMFYNFEKILPEGGHVVFLTKLGKKKYFNVFGKIIDLARKNGFEYVSRVSIEKKDPTLRKQSAFRNTLINEVVIVFQKLNSNDRYLYINNENYEAKIIDFVYRTVKSLKDDSITVTELVYNICREITQLGEHVTPQITKRIHEIIDHNFYISVNQEVQLSKNVLYLDQEDDSTLFKKLYELVPTYIERILNKKGRFVLEELYLELIDDLSDGNNQTLLDIINDDKNIEEIASLVEDKTEVEEIGRAFSRKECEDLCKKLLEMEGFLNVHRKGGSGDMGVDVVGEHFNGNKKEFWLVQCKRWVSNVGSTPLQRLVSERERLGAQQIACYTTSDYTSDAKIVAKSQGVIIVNGKELIQMLDKHFHGKYYNSNI